MDHPKKILDQYGVRPKKSLGQNFITQESVLSTIVDAADLKESDRVCEIGPGIGDLTRLIARRVQEVVAVEIDERLFHILTDRLASMTNVKLEHADGLQFDPGKFFNGPFKVIANLPYYITGAFLRNIYSRDRKPAIMVLTIQEEVARRITASPGEMSLLAVAVQYYADVKIIRTIGAGSFWPRPDVNSAAVRFDLRSGFLLPIQEESALFLVIRAGFSQRRKQLQNNLKQLNYSGQAVDRALARAGIDGRRRAQSLSVEEWVALYEQLAGNVSPI